MTSRTSRWALVAAPCGSVPAYAQISGDTIQIGMITDLSGVDADIDTCT